MFEDSEILFSCPRCCSDKVVLVSLGGVVQYAGLVTMEDSLDEAF